MRDRKMLFFKIEDSPMMGGPVMLINRRLCKINQLSPQRNLHASFLIVVTAVLAGTVYGAAALALFHKLWYHKLLSLVSAVIFVYLIVDIYFEIKEKRIKKEIPNTLKVLSHYYSHYHGNVVAALDETITRCAANNKVFLLRLRDAILSADSQRQVERLEAVMPSVWLKMLCRLMHFAKENGGHAALPGAQDRQADVIARNLKRLNHCITRLSIEQEFNNVELLSMQLFVFLFPYFVIPISQWYNTSLLRDIDMDSIYGSIQAQSLTAAMMMISNLGTVFIHWMRKLQN